MKSVRVSSSSNCTRLSVLIKFEIVPTPRVVVVACIRSYKGSKVVASELSSKSTWRQSKGTGDPKKNYVAPTPLRQGFSSRYIALTIFWMDDSKVLYFCVLACTTLHHVVCHPHMHALVVCVHVQVRHMRHNTRRGSES